MKDISFFSLLHRNSIRDSPGYSSFRILSETQALVLNVHYHIIVQSGCSIQHVYILRSKKEKKGRTAHSFLLRVHTALLIASYWPELSCHIVILVAVRLGMEALFLDSSVLN